MPDPTAPEPLTLKEQAWLYLQERNMAQQRVAELEKALAHAHRDLETCTRDGQGLATRLDEEEQRAEQLEGALRALVDKDEDFFSRDGEGDRFCPYCSAWEKGTYCNGHYVTEHPDWCPVAVARALLATEKEAG